MHDAMIMHKRKITNKFNMGIFLGSYRATTQNFVSMRDDVTHGISLLLEDECGILTSPFKEVLEAISYGTK
jgi:ACT domain-containing protein